MLRDFLSFYQNNLKIASVNNNLITIEIIKDVSASLEGIKNIFEIESQVGNSIEINLNKVKLNNTYFYLGDSDFFNRFDLSLEEFKISDIIILREDNSTIYKIKDEEFIEEKKIFFNYVQYKNFLTKLKKIKSFNKINSIDNEFILVSKTNSVMHIGYYNNEQRVTNLENLEPNIQDLFIRFEKFTTTKNSTENEEYIKFFIENISTIGVVNFSKQDRLFEILKEVKILIAITDRDYDNYVNDFSFEKIKSKFKEERNKYFDSIEKNLENINKQVLSYPLTFGATAFASYQVKDKPIILFLIFISFLMYTIIVIKALNISSYNLDCLENDVSIEEFNIKNTFNKNYSFFKDDFSKIHTKIYKIKDLIFILKFVFYTILLMFSLFIFLQINSNNSKNVEKLTIPIDKIKIIEVIQ